jgi:hypothetical protein
VQRRDRPKKPLPEKSQQPCPVWRSNRLGDLYIWWHEWARQVLNLARAVSRRFRE